MGRRLLLLGRSTKRFQVIQEHVGGILLAFLTTTLSATRSSLFSGNVYAGTCQPLSRIPPETS